VSILIVFEAYISSQTLKEVHLTSKTVFKARKRKIVLESSFDEVYCEF